jgi:hypothetical protein
VLLPLSISVCTPPSSPILKAANTLPHLQLSVDSTTVVVREFGKDTDNNIEDIMLSLSLEDSATSPTLPQTTPQYAPTVSRASSAQFRSFWTRFRSDTKSGSPYACEMSLKSQASLKPSLFSVASRGRPCIPSFSTPPLSKVMDEWERNDLSRTQYLCTKAPSSADGTICPHVATLGQERSKAYFDAELVGVTVNIELQEDDQGNHFFFEQDMISEEGEVPKESGPHLQGLVGATSMYGVEDGDLAVLVPLYPRGSDSKDVRGGAPLSYVTEGERKAAVQPHEKAEILGFKDQYSWKPLWQAAASGHEAIVRQLLETGKLTRLDLEDKDGRTPLSWAASSGHEAVVKLLLKKGAELETKDKEYGRTPLSWAAFSGYGAVVELLLEKGAELETKSNKGWTPLSYAAEKGDQCVLKLLLEKGTKRLQ